MLWLSCNTHYAEILCYNGFNVPRCIMSIVCTYNVRHEVARMQKSSRVASQSRNLQQNISEKLQHWRKYLQNKSVEGLPQWKLHAWQAACAGLAAAIVTAPAQAYNVRIEDVESPSLQAGLQAATHGRYEEAERFFNIFLKEEPSSASAWSNLGNVHLSQGRTDQAVLDFTKAIQLAPEAPVPYLNRAIALEQLGVDQEALGNAEGALELWNEAMRDCDAATERDPQEFVAWFDRGNVAMRLERYDQALEDYRTAANLAPGLAGYRLREATLLYQQGEPEGAKTMMQGIVRKYPRYAEAYAALAAISWVEGKQANAEEQFERATQQEARWGDMEFVRSSTRWPPALYRAMEQFLSLSGS